MKRNLLNLLMFVCSMSMFMACSDNDEPNIPIEKELAGTYKGNLDIAMNGTGLANGLPKNITITKAGGVSAINLELRDFSFMGLNLGDIIISDCEMLKYRDRYTFSGSQKLTLPAPIGECTVVANGTLVGREIAVSLDIAVAALSQTVKVAFKGAKLAGNESSEAKITSFTFDTSNEANSIVSAQPVIKDGTVTFVVAEGTTAEQIKALVPSIVISEKATLVPASNTIDFNNPFVYTVVAENGSTAVYTVKILGKLMTFDFEEWEKKYTLFGQPFEDPKGWSSSNGGSVIMGTSVVEKTTEAHSGQLGVSIKTFDTGADSGNVIPKITTGSLFLGDFQLNMMDALASTLFGVMYDKKPLFVKGYYKYTAGNTFYRCADPVNNKGVTVEEKGTVDECAINVILYEVSSEEEAPLTGHNVYTSEDKVVAIAKLADGSPKANWTEFNLELDYKKAFDPARKYRFSIICSSSKYGDQFSGAPESTLIVDDFELITE